MPRLSNKLSATAIKRLGAGMHHDGGGLYLQVKNGGRSWLLRYMMDRKPRYMGLGPLRDLSLAEARNAARHCRQSLRNGIDPIDERLRRRTERRAELAKSMSFENCAARLIKSSKAGWRSAKHAAQWDATLSKYAYPVFGKLPVQQIDTGLVMKVLEPIWAEKTETASRLRQRIEAVLDWAKAHGHRTGENPCRWRGHLDKLLPRPRKVAAVQHFTAMPYSDIPGFFAKLGSRNAASAKALAFTILTASRTRETRLAVSDEIDAATSIWVVPGDRTKSGREHRVPLTKSATSLLPRVNDHPHRFLFPNSDGKALSDAAMRKYLQEDLGYPELTVHGFRSSFRDWVHECTNFPGEIAEAALGHVVGDKTEAAYRRGDALVRRRRLMGMWEKFCISGSSPARQKEMSA